MKKGIRILLISFLFAGLAAGSAPAANKICATCGKGVADTYWEYNGNPYCSQRCFEAALPACSACGRPVGAGNLQGKYFRVQDKIFCSEKCFLSSLPKCSACGQPARRQIRAAGEGMRVYCSEECYRTALPQCHICQTPLSRWVEVQSRKYCDDCARRPKCLNCRLPGADRELPDGRRICSQCLKTAIVEREQAEGLFREVREDIDRHLGLRTGNPIQFFLIDARDLAALVGRRSLTEQGFYNRRARYRTQKGITSLESETFAVYLLSALSPAYFRNAAAHELAHDIGHARFPGVQGKEDVEGFAEYLSSLMNRYWGNERLNREKLENQERDYARGYRKFLDLAGKGGLPDVLAYMEKMNQLSSRENMKKDR